MQQAKMNRAEMIRKLVAFSVQSALSEGSNHYWLSELFEKGFRGYASFSDRQLLMEMQLRGLVPEDEALGDEIDESEVDDDEFDSISDFIPMKEEME